MKKRSNRWVPTLMLIVFFLLSAYSFMYFMYCLSECIASAVSGSPDEAIRGALRSLPIFLSFFLSLSGLMIARSFYHSEVALLRQKTKKHAVIGLVTGATILIHVFVMRITGSYLSIAEGGPSRLYPLDALLYALAFIAFDIFVLKYSEKAGRPNAAAQRPALSLGGILCFIPRAIWLLVGLYGFCGSFFGIFIVDFRGGYLPYSLAMLLMFLVAFLSIAVRELYYYDLGEAKQRAVLLPLSFISLAVSLVTLILYLLALKYNTDGPANVSLGLLPVAGSSSVNIATMLVAVTPVIVSLTALLKGLIAAKKNQ